MGKSCLEKVKTQRGVKCKNVTEPGARALWTVECETSEDIEEDGIIDMHIQRPLPYHMRPEPLSKGVKSLPIKKGRFTMELVVDAPVPGWLMPQGEYESETKLLSGKDKTTVLG